MESELLSFFSFAAEQRIPSYQVCNWCKMCLGLVHRNALFVCGRHSKPIWLVLVGISFRLVGMALSRSHWQILGAYVQNGIRYPWCLLVFVTSSPCNSFNGGTWNLGIPSLHTLWGCFISGGVSSFLFFGTRLPSAGVCFRSLKIAETPRSHHRHDEIDSGLSRCIIPSMLLVAPCYCSGAVRQAYLRGSIEGRYIGAFDAFDDKTPFIWTSIPFKKCRPGPPYVLQSRSHGVY